MKAMNILRTSPVVVGLGLSAFLAAPCQAQSEITPDIYDSNGLVAMTPHMQKVLPQEKQIQTADLQAKFTLPYELQCAGRVLAPAEYSLSVGPDRMVTVRGKDGMILRIRPRVASELTRAGRSMLLVQRNGELRALKAIYLEELGLVLHLEPDGKVQLARILDQGERVPLLVASR